MGKLSVRARCSCTALVLLLCDRGAQSTEIRGVGPKDSERYAEAATNQGFHCLGAPDVAAVLNDDFCDCADGSDEPGTAACAGQEGGGEAVHFYCPNNASQPRYLYRSRINDGICDCCDGSDEWMSQRCADTCFEEGRAFREAEQQRQERWARGTQLQRELLESHESQISAWQGELEQARAALPALEQDSKEKKKHLDESKAKLPPEPEVSPTPAPAPPPVEKEEMKPEEQLAELNAALDPGLKGERLALAMLKGQCKSKKDGTFTYKICFFHKATQAEGDKSVITLGRWSHWDFSEDPPKAYFEDGQECPGGAKRRLVVKFRCGSKVKLKAVSEPAQCLYEADFLHPGVCDDSKAPEGTSEEEKRESWSRVVSARKELLASAESTQEAWRSEKQALEEKLGEEQPKVSEYAKWMEGAGDAKSSEVTEASAEGAAAEGGEQGGEKVEETPEQKEHREAKASWEQASGAARDVKHRIWSLEARLHPELLGSARALGSLSGECLKKQVDQFAYRFCFFKHVYQDTDSEKDVSLGRWLGWDFAQSPPQARFGRGAPCGNGVRRSLTVSFSCGSEAAVERVTESKACVYEAEVLHPAACDASSPPERQVLQPLMPRDEL